MVRNYTTEELLKKVKSILSFKEIPKDVWILGVRSKEDLYNTFDDKFYIFKGEKFLFVISGSTNPGNYGLINFLKWNNKGVAVVKADEWYYNVWTYGLHKGKMPALKQIRPFKILRDNNKDRKSGNVSNWNWEGGIGINFHANTYNLKNVGLISNLINGWSVGCQVINNIAGYKKVIELTKNQPAVTFCLINED